jgi:putative ABC transport system ATP-binding protein
MSEPAIDITGLEFAWAANPTLLQIAQLRIERGERVFLTGASGSGKSTLLGLIAGVLLPRKGTLRLMGSTMNALRASERDRFRGEHLGFIFQMFNLIPYLTILENVILPLQFSPARAGRLGTTSAKDEAVRLLMVLGLGAREFLNRSVIELSMGQQQRVAAARALIGRPQVLIADEPTSSLDVDARQDFLRLLMNECRESGTTVLFVSHDRSLSSLFDRSLALADLNSAPPAAH